MSKFSRYFKYFIPRLDNRNKTKKRNKTNITKIYCHNKLTMLLLSDFKNKKFESLNLVISLLYVSFYYRKLIIQTSL